VGFCDGQKRSWGRFSPRTSVSPAKLHSIMLSTIIFIITRGWHNMPGVAAVPSLIVQIKIKKNNNVIFVLSAIYTQFYSKGSEDFAAES
jgi:hypothetical protein